jgi:hypothetical protein
MVPSLYLLGWAEENKEKRRSEYPVSGHKFDPLEYEAENSIHEEIKSRLKSKNAIIRSESFVFHLRHTELSACRLFYMGAKLGRSH